MLVDTERILEPYKDVSTNPEVHPGVAPAGLKRAFDVAVAGTGFAAVAPFIAFGALISFAAHGSNPFFTQERVGLDGELFKIYKIKSLHFRTDEHGQPLPSEERRSWASTFLRASRIDELPQLLNVLEGTMSLVGPRPHIPEEAAGRAQVCLSVRPGMTGLAQVNGHNSLPDEAKFEYDRIYAENQHNGNQLMNLLDDIRILACSPAALISNIFDP